jgi:hypothetical protein
VAVGVGFALARELIRERFFVCDAFGDLLVGCAGIRVLPSCFKRRPCAGIRLAPSRRGRCCCVLASALASAICLRASGVAPVRGGTYFSLPPQRKVGKRKRLTPPVLVFA